MIAPASPTLPNCGLQGHLHLVCALDERGRSIIREQSFRAPMHISKPYTDADTLVVNIVNPTAGLLAGDQIDCDVRVESGAKLLLTTPSANRAHRMKSGQAAIHQRFIVADKASLENWPEIFIPQGGTSYSQTTRIEVSGEGELMFWELLAPGRVASAEVFEFADLEWSTHVLHNQHLILRERYRLVPGEPSVEAWRTRFPAGYFASGIIVTPHLHASAKVWREIHDLQSDELWVGCSQLCKAGASIRILAPDSVSIRKTLGQIRSLLYLALNRPAPILRRVG